MIRDIFAEYVWRFVIQDEMKLRGDVEIDESMFGRKCKYHRGNPHVGCKVWVVGLVERGSGRMILYPVENRDEATILKIVRRHVLPGSRIFTDGWGSYRKVNDLGCYEHFTVIHKRQYLKLYRHVASGAILKVHTNTIEGAWNHAKKHFQDMAGTTIGNFESHLCEIMFRNHTKG